MSKEKAKKKSVQRSWRAIQQSSNRRPVTPIAKRRRLFILLKFLSGATLAILLLGALLYYYFIPNTKQYLQEVGENHIEKIVFKSDGVLDAVWLQKFLKFPKNTNLMEVDLFETRNRLEFVGQIKHATIERIFPDKLKVVLEEHQPILCVAVKEKSGKVSRLLISIEGQIYEGINYSKRTLAQLPFIAGVQLTKRGDAYESIVGIEPLAEFLMTTRIYKPYLFRKLKVVSSTCLMDRQNLVHDTIKVEFRDKTKAVFSIGNYNDQLDRLDYILGYMNKFRLPSAKRIDLALGNEAAVQFDKRKNLRFLR